MPSCNTYHLTWVSLTLDEGYLLTAALPDLQRGSASVVINHEAHTSATFCSFPRPCDSLPSAAPPHLCLGFQNSVSYYYFIVLAKSFILLWSYFHLVLFTSLSLWWVFQNLSGSVGKESACNAGDLGLIPRLGRSH